MRLLYTSVFNTPRSSATSFATPSMTHAPAQESVVIDFAAPANHSDYYRSATGRYEDDDQRKIELADIKAYVVKLRFRIRDIDSRDGKDKFETRIKSLFDCLYWYQNKYDIPSVAECWSIPEFLHWVENKWGLEEPSIYQLLDQMWHAQKAKGRDGLASMGVRIGSEYSTWAHEELKLPLED